MSFLSWINRDQVKDLLNRSGFPSTGAAGQDPNAPPPMLPGAMPVPQTAAPARSGQFRPLSSPPDPVQAAPTQMVRPTGFNLPGGGSVVVPGLPTEEDTIVGEELPYQEEGDQGQGDDASQYGQQEPAQTAPTLDPSSSQESPESFGLTVQLHGGSKVHPRLIPRPSTVRVAGPATPGTSSAAPAAPTAPLGKIGIPKPQSVPTPTTPTRTGSIKIPAKSGDTSQIKPGDSAKVRTGKSSILGGSSGKLPKLAESTKLKPKSGDTSKLPKMDKSSLKPKSGDTSKIPLVTPHKMASAKLPAPPQVPPGTGRLPLLRKSVQPPQTPSTVAPATPTTPPGQDPSAQSGTGDRTRRPFLPNLRPLTVPDATMMVPLSEMATQPMRPTLPKAGKPEIPATQKFSTPAAQQPHSVGPAQGQTVGVSPKTRGPFPMGVKPPQGVTSSSVKAGSSLMKGSTQRLPPVPAQSVNADMLRQVQELEANFGAMLERARVAEDRCTSLQNELEAYRVQIEDTEVQLNLERHQREELAELAANLRLREEHERARLQEDERRLAQARAELEGTAETFQKERLELSNARLMLREMETNNRRLARQLEVRAEEAERASALIED
ncbi:MAG TPA: hypothetical protein VK970_10525, partial [Candidatus Methylacidiphilales bacterium]|nr:hypothetical protein [Candidatus Methylacidiphilales bacterium]